MRCGSPRSKRRRSRVATPSRPLRPCPTSIARHSRVNKSSTVSARNRRSVGELVGDEIHAPDVVSSRRWPSRLAMHGGRVTPRPFPPERQSFLDVQPVNALLSDVPAFPSQQNEQSPIAKPHPGLCQLSQALSERSQWISTTFVPNARETEAGGPHRPSLMTMYRPIKYCTTSRCLTGFRTFFGRRPGASPCPRSDRRQRA